MKKNKMDIESKNNHLLKRSIEKPRQGWSEAFKKMHELGEDKMLIPDFF